MTIMTTVDSACWPEPVRVLSKTDSPLGFVTIEAMGLETGRHYSTTMRAEDWGAVTHETRPAFDAKPAEFRLAIEAERLRLAYSCDPLLATNNARVDLVPHQLEAVYDVMLPQPAIRHLVAHDAGAGKTVMCGLLHKELRLRRPELRTLIVAPAALVVQWQRELEDKFSERFKVVGREQLTENPCTWVETQQAITSVSFAQQSDIRATLASVPWDLVIVDEAHHMAGYEDRATLAYELGRVLARQCTHLILATATPHKGDRTNFLKLLQLLDPAIHDPDIVRQVGERRGGALMLRRLKEEMVDFQGAPLFKRRVVQTRPHVIADNPPEMALYSALTDYVTKTYHAAERLGGRERVNVQFAMVFLQRRMASSLAALRQSLVNRRAALLNPRSLPQVSPPTDYDEDAPESERWRVEAELQNASPARSKHERDKEAAEIAALLERVEAVTQSGRQTKVEALRRVMDEAGILAGNGEKLLVFTEFKDTLDELRRLFEGWGFKVTQIDGSMPPVARPAAEAEFRSDAYQVMVATEAAGEGINLQFCAHMVNYDLPWVPTRLEQRMGRIHRYGQRRVCHIYNLAAADTREGQVLAGLLKRLDEMRASLGDQVFDVVSSLIADVDMRQKLTDVVLAPATEASQEVALRDLLSASERGERRFQEWKEHPYPLDPARYLKLQQASRQSRLTPEYAQHFFVDALRQMQEQPVAEGSGSCDPGDADVLRVSLLRPTVAAHLGLRIGQPTRLTFRQSVVSQHKGILYVTLGTPPFEGALGMARSAWSGTLARGAVYLDTELAPGGGYLLWFFGATVFDGLGHEVTRAIYAVRQAVDGVTSAPASTLIDLVPSAQQATLPQWLLGLARDPGPALHWSIANQQLAFVSNARTVRGEVVRLRRAAMLHDAQAALESAQAAYNEAVFGASDADVAEAERQQAEAATRVSQLRRRYEHEAACWLGPSEVLAVAAVLPVVDAPLAEQVDQKREVEQAAMRHVMTYERSRGREVVDVTGEHRLYPYDLHSTGPGGPRCIEVKGTTTGRVLLSENERRAGIRLAASYYLYIVTDPLGAAALSIVRDPLAKMQHDDVLYGGARYGYDERTWRPAAEEETSPA